MSNKVNPIIGKTIAEVQRHRADDNNIHLQLKFTDGSAAFLLLESELKITQSFYTDERDENPKDIKL